MGGNGSEGLGNVIVEGTALGPKAKLEWRQPHELYLL